eukprot:COSAG02_NODE_58497_length_277_cov_0.584270_1_plen_58_part_00
MGPKGMAGVPMRVIGLDSSEVLFYYALPNDRLVLLSIVQVITVPDGYVVHCMRVGSS